MTSYAENSVTVLGLGPMGRILAGAFLNAGLSTTVWNRTPGRYRELVERGAVRARWAREVVEVLGQCVRR
jgi:3-hydroxyisobutyrate dehydrogenase-like beta-hydroxyacid dehydrogenase